MIIIIIIRLQQKPKYVFGNYFVLKFLTRLYLLLLSSPPPKNISLFWKNAGLMHSSHVLICFVFFLFTFAPCMTIYPFCENQVVNNSFDIYVSTCLSALQGQQNLNINRSDLYFHCLGVHFCKRIKGYYYCIISVLFVEL